MIKDLVYELSTNEHSFYLFFCGCYFSMVYSLLLSLTNYLWERFDEILDKRKQERGKKKMINELSYLISYNDFQELIELLKNVRGLCTPDEIEFIDDFISNYNA